MQVYSQKIFKTTFQNTYLCKTTQHRLRENMYNNFQCGTRSYYYHGSEFRKTILRNLSQSDTYSIRVLEPITRVWKFVHLAISSTFQSSSANCFKFPLQLILVSHSFFNHYPWILFVQSIKYLLCSTCSAPGTHFFLEK